MAGQPITLTLPSIGDPFSTAAAQVTAAITVLETELERKVVPADMSMATDLSFLVNAVPSRVKDLLCSSYTLLGSALSASTYPRSLYFTGADGDAYVNDGAGRQVRLTSSGAVNVATTGAITSTGSPAYGASGVELRWDGADLEYEARAGSGTNDYADIRLDDVVFNDGSANFIRMTAPAISADYTVTLPTAVPASTSVVQMSSSGALTASPSGNIATTGTLGCGAVTVTSNAHVTVAGTGQYKHGAKVRTFSLYHSRGADLVSGSVDDDEGSVWVVANALPGKAQLAVLDAIRVFSLNFDVGERITNMTVYYDPADTSTKTYRIVEYNALTNTRTAFTQTSAANGAMQALATLNLTLTCSVGCHYWAEVAPGNVADVISHIEITYDRP